MHKFKRQRCFGNAKMECVVISLEFFFFFLKLGKTKTNKIIRNSFGLVLFLSRCLWNGLQSERHGQRGSDGGVEESACAADGRGRANVDLARDLAAQTNGKVRASQHRPVSP